MLRKKTKNKTAIRRSQDQQRKQPLGQEKKPFIEHVRELRTRVMYIALAVALFGGLAAFFQKQLTEIILHPAGKQQFIFTNPGGGFDFVFQLCLAAGVFAGGLVSAVSGGRFRLMTERGATAGRSTRLLLALFGGVLAGFASRLAQGCTSGQALSGGAMLLTGSFVFLGCLFATGYLTAWMFRRQWK